MTPAIAAIGSYTSDAGGRGDGITIVIVDPGTGRIEPIAKIAARSPSFLAWSGNLLVAANATDPGTVSSYRWTGHSLQILDITDSLGGRPCHIGVHASGRQLITANYSGGTFMSVVIGAAGGFGNSRMIKHRGSGTHPTRQDQPHPHCSIYSADGRTAALLDIGLDSISFHDVCPDGLNPTPRQEFHMTPGSGPRHAVRIPDGLAVVCEINATLAVIRWPKLGAARLLSDFPTTRPADHDACPSEIATGPNGTLLVANRNTGSITEFTATTIGLIVKREIPIPPANLRHSQFLAVVPTSLCRTPTSSLSWTLIPARS